MKLSLSTKKLFGSKNFCTLHCNGNTNLRNLDHFSSFFMKFNSVLEAKLVLDTQNFTNDDLRTLKIFVILFLSI